MWCLLLHVAVSTPPSQSLSLQAAHGQCSPRRKPASCGAVTAGSDQGSRRRKAGMHCPVELSANGCVKGRKRSKRAAEPASGSRAAGALQALQGEAGEAVKRGSGGQDAAPGVRAYVHSKSRRFKYVTTTASFRGKWKAQMRDDKGRQVHKGLFATQEEAAEAVDRQWPQTGVAWEGCDFSSVVHTICYAQLCRHLMAMRRQPVNFPAAHYEAAGEAATQPPFSARGFYNEGSGISCGASSGQDIDGSVSVTSPPSLYLSGNAAGARADLLARLLTNSSLTLPATASSQVLGDLPQMTLQCLSALLGCSTSAVVSASAQPCPIPAPLPLTAAAVAKWLSLPPLTKEVPLAAALCSAPWPQQGATSEPEPFSQAAAGTISLRPAPLAPDEDNSPVGSSNAAASGFERADIARGTCGQLEPVVPGAHASQLLPPVAGAGSSGVSAPIEEPPAVQWARARTQEQQMEDASGVRRQEVRQLWLLSLAGPAVAVRTRPPAAVIAPSGAALHNSGAGSEAAAMLAAVAAAKERQADESHMLGYFAAHGGSGAAAAEQAGAATTRSARQGLGEVPAGSLARAASVHDSALEGVGGREVLLQALRQNPEARLRLLAALGRKVGSHSEVVRSGPAPEMQLQ
eukprot:jgi/Astpho2/3672/Aster-04863